MNLFRLLNQSRLALSKEHELTYHGMKYKKVFSKITKNSKFTGFFFQTLIFFYRVFQSINFFNIKFKPKQIYIFAETINQLSSLKTTIESLRQNQNDIHLTVSKTLFRQSYDKKKEAAPISFNFGVIFTGILLFLTRGLPLYFKLKNKNHEINIAVRFSEICMSYIYIPYFLDILQKLRPKLIIVSNDHNLNNRSLRLSAEVLGIKTIYLQHASVVDHFPPLQFDYALLDGKIAYETYLKCYHNIRTRSENLEKNVANCKVILSGQKRKIFNNIRKNNNDSFYIGLAVNELDNFNSVRCALDIISLSNTKCIIRTHPHQQKVFIKQLEEYLKTKYWLSWSDARKEQISDYFNKISLLIAGNSSIHLEAALAGLITYYYEMHGDFEKPDLYGYIQNGLTIRLEKEFSYETLSLDIKNRQNLAERKLIIKNYSETFGTSWENHEDKLTVIIINRILNNKKFDDLFEIKKSDVYHSVSSLLKPNVKF